LGSQLIHSALEPAHSLLLTVSILRDHSLGRATKQHKRQQQSSFPNLCHTPPPALQVQGDTHQHFNAFSDNAVLAKLTGKPFSGHSLPPYQSKRPARKLAFIPSVKVE
jgi:hypothetical protein